MSKTLKQQLYSVIRSSILVVGLVFVGSVFVLFMPVYGWWLRNV